MSASVHSREEEGEAVDGQMEAAAPVRRVLDDSRRHSAAATIQRQFHAYLSRKGCAGDGATARGDADGAGGRGDSASHGVMSCCDDVDCHSDGGHTPSRSRRRRV